MMYKFSGWFTLKSVILLFAFMFMSYSYFKLLKFYFFYMHLCIFNVVLMYSHSWVIPAFRDFIVPRLSNFPHPQFCCYYSHPIIFLETEFYSVILLFRPSFVQPSPWTPYHSGCSESQSLHLISAPLPPPASRLWGAALFTTFIGSSTLLCRFTRVWMSVP